MVKYNKIRWILSNSWLTYKCAEFIYSLLNKARKWEKRKLSLKKSSTNNYPKTRSNGLIRQWIATMPIPSRHSLIGPRNPSFLKISSQNQPKKVGLVLFWVKCKENIQNMSYSIKARSSRDMASSNPWRTHSTTSYPFMKVSWMISKKVHHHLPRKWIQPKKLVPKRYQIRKKSKNRFHQM